MFWNFFILLLFAVAKAAVKPNYITMPDGDGNPVLVDLNAVEPEVASSVPLQQPEAFNSNAFVTVVENSLLNTGSLPVEEAVILYCYTKRNPDTPQFITRNTVAANFNFSRPLRFVIHGYLSSAKNMKMLKDAYLASDIDYNIVMVDWSKRSYSLYTSAKSYTKEVGTYVADIIKILVSNYNASMDDTWIIGHSLGAHCAGIAGNRLGGKLRRVVGMDAAAPLYQLDSHLTRLDRSDAIFVQGIHTSIPLGTPIFYGHCDFYPNGGLYQPGCYDLYGGCSHGRSRDYYAESINSWRFVGHKWRSFMEWIKLIFFMQSTANFTAIMGEHSPECRGRYFLKTNKKSPFARG